MTPITPGAVMGTVAGWRQRLWQGGGMSSARGWQDGCFCRWQDEDMAEARREGSGLQAIDIRDRGREMGAGRRREAAAKWSATTITAAQTCAGCRKKQLPKTARPARRLIRGNAGRPRERLLCLRRGIHRPHAWRVGRRLLCSLQSLLIPTSSTRLRAPGSSSGAP